MASSLFQGLTTLFLWIVLQQSFASGISEFNSVLERNDSNTWKIGNLMLIIGEQVILQSNVREGDVPSFLAELRVGYTKDFVPPTLCENQESDTICLKWKDKTSLKVKRLNSFCHEVLWNSSEVIQDCVSYGNASWYGGPELYNQKWPVEKVKLVGLPYVTSINGNLGVVEPYWFNSRGLFLFVHYDVPLFIDSNNDKNNSLCFISNASYPYNSEGRNHNLKYRICQLDNARKAREYAVQENIINKPSNIPDTRMIQHPIWSTWVQFYSNINETKVLAFAKSIIKYGFNNSQIEIDDKWETCYGSKVIDKKRFPNMKNFSATLNELGFRITLWTHPFVNFGCSNYSHLNESGYFVTNKTGYKKVKWWDGTGSVFDFTNEEAKKWFIQVHKNLLEEFRLDGFKFDSGECNFLPKNSILNGDQNDYPKLYTSAYINTLSVFGGITETRVGYRSTSYPNYVRMLDKDSRWDVRNGLRSLITTCLLMNIQGYPWVIPDMVGGNAYRPYKVTEELFVRWLQANTFMPVIQFSFAPWDFKNQAIIDITKKFTSLHYSYSEKIIELMNKTLETGAPLNPPIWWIDPKDPVALAIDTEYLLGEEILVAPVVDDKARERDVYLPRGKWQDGNNASNIHDGPCWIKGYPADLSTLPYFINMNSI